MLCAKCNCDNPADALFCMKCGAKVENRCSSCNTVNPAEAKFCRKCGGALVAGAPASSPSPATAAKTPRVEVTHERPDGGELGGRAQDGHRAVRRHQGLDRVDARSRSRGGARDRRPGAAADDGGGASLRRLRCAIDRRRNLCAVRRACRARRPSAARAACGAGDAGGVAALRRTSRGQGQIPGRGPRRG